MYSFAVDGVVIKESHYYYLLLILACIVDQSYLPAVIHVFRIC